MEDGRHSSVILFEGYKSENVPQLFDLHNKKLEQ